MFIFQRRACFNNDGLTKVFDHLSKHAVSYLLGSQLNATVGAYVADPGLNTFIAIGATALAVQTIYYGLQTRLTQPRSLPINILLYTQSCIIAFVSCSYALKTAKSDNQPTPSYKMIVDFARQADACGSGSSANFNVTLLGDTVRCEGKNNAGETVEFTFSRNMAGEFVGSLKQPIVKKIVSTSFFGPPRHGLGL